MSNRLADHEAWKTWPLPEGDVSLRDWQNGRCAWCGDDRVRLVEDHCHDTGFIRGLLCNGCNIQEGTSAGPAWNGWREGDTPARAIGHVEVYERGWYGTTLSPYSPLNYYSPIERREWWDLCVANGDLPTCVPWSDSAKLRKDADWAQMEEASARLDLWLTSPEARP